MPDLGHIFIHPLLHPDESWAGLFVDFAATTGDFKCVLARLAGHPSLGSPEHPLLWFIPAAEPASLADSAALAGKDMVFLLPAAAPVDRAKLETELQQTGATLGLMATPHDPLPPTGAWPYLFLNASHARTLPAYSLVGLAIRTAIGVTSLRSRSDFTWASGNQCSLFSCEYLLHRATPCNKPDMLRMRLLKLLSLIAEDADTSEMEEVFRQEPKLAYSLLRLVNAAALGPRQLITSFSQAIAILGRQQLQRWLQLLIFADPNDQQHANPLLLLAATRGRLMEMLAGNLRNGSESELSSDAAFMIGTFSLLDVLLNLPMAEILVQLPLPGIVHAALAEHRGPLGKLLQALAAAGNHDLESARHLLTQLGISGDTFLSSQLSALAWASSIRVSSQ